MLLCIRRQWKMPFWIFDLGQVLPWALSILLSWLIINPSSFHIEIYGHSKRYVKKDQWQSFAFSILHCMSMNLVLNTPLFVDKHATCSVLFCSVLFCSALPSHLNLISFTCTHKSTRQTKALYQPQPIFLPKHLTKPKISHL